jgi:hypothetical protein
MSGDLMKKASRKNPPNALKPLFSSDHVFIGTSEPGMVLHRRKTIFPKISQMIADF